jgi:hypothetical protein
VTVIELMAALGREIEPHGSGGSAPLQKVSRRWRGSPSDECHRTASKLITGADSAFRPTPEKIEELRADWKQHHSRATYQALLKHDREWLHEQCKHDRRVVVELPIPPAHDDILAAKIRDAVRRVRSAGSDLNLATISREIGFRIIRTHLEEYPLSKAEVLAVCPIVPRPAKGGRAKKAPRSSPKTEEFSSAP